MNKISKLVKEQRTSEGLDGWMNYKQTIKWMNGWLDGWMDK